MAELAPTLIGGVTVRRATLHNEEEVKRLGLFPGVRVILKRAGDVIPKIVSALPSDNQNTTMKPFKFPDECPLCRSPVLREDGGSIARCSGGLKCPAQATESMM